MNVCESVQSQGSFYDDYSNALASLYMDKEIDYSKVVGLSFAKTYVYLNQDLNSSQLNELREKGSSFLIDEDGSLSCLIAIKTPLSESDLGAIYGVYQQLEAINREFDLQVAFSASGEDSKEYVNNFPLNGKMARI